MFRIVILAFLFLCAFAPNVSATLSMSSPWMAGDRWQASGECDGSYYGEDAHQYPLQYGIDFNLAPPHCTNDSMYPILAVYDGTVSFVGWSDGYGYLVKIDHGSIAGVNVTTFYAHFHENNPFAVVNGEHVQRGQVIGFCGTSGKSSGTHLHFELRENGVSVPVSLDGHYYCENKSDPECKGYTLVSRNAFVFNRAYDLFGSSLIGLPEYDMWDINKARSLNPHHPWYSAWNPSDLYRSGGIPRNCYIQHLDGGTFWDSAIVYDALGGARQAYVLHSGFWVTWTNRGGPLSSLGMPITNEYTQGPSETPYFEARQDLQLGYLYYKQGANPEITVHTYPVCAPGWTEQGWDPSVSYRIAQKYERYEARNVYGEATSVARRDGTVWKQTFQYGFIAVPVEYTAGRVYAQEAEPDTSSSLYDPSSFIWTSVDLTSLTPVEYIDTDSSLASYINPFSGRWHVLLNGRNQRIYLLTLNSVGTVLGSLDVTAQTPLEYAAPATSPSGYVDVASGKHHLVFMGRNGRIQEADFHPNK